MKVLAITKTGAEYLYKANTAHKVNAKKIEWVCGLLNRQKWGINDGEMWRVYEIDKYDNAYYYAQRQSFITGKRGTYERKSA